MGWAYGTTSNKGWCISSCSLLPINWIGEQLVREPDATKVACWVRQAVKECFFYIPICMTENVYGSNPYSPNLFGKKNKKIDELRIELNRDMDPQRFVAAVAIIGIVSIERFEKGEI